jgi:hypothetical protein
MTKEVTFQEFIDGTPGALAAIEYANRCTIDHPRVRNSARCPLCYGPKDVGLIACWGCYRSNELRNGNPDTEVLLDQREAMLAGEVAT